jgi:hypothetical protein
MPACLFWMRMERRSSRRTAKRWTFTSQLTSTMKLLRSSMQIITINHQLTDTNIFNQQTNYNLFNPEEIQMQIKL